MGKLNVQMEQYFICFYYYEYSMHVPLSVRQCSHKPVVNLKQIKALPTDTVEVEQDLQNNDGNIINYSILEWKNLKGIAGKVINKAILASPTYVRTIQYI